MVTVTGPQWLIFTMSGTGSDDLITIEYNSTGAANPP